MSAEGYTAFQERLEADIANVRRLLDILERGKGGIVPFLPRGVKLDADIDSARVFMTALATILMLRIATPEEVAANLPNPSKGRR